MNNFQCMLNKDMDKEVYKVKRFYDNSFFIYCV